MTMTTKMVAAGAAVLAFLASAPRPQAQAPAPGQGRGQQAPPQPTGPVGPSPYDVVRGWHKPFSEPGFAFGGNSGIFAESPNRIFVAQRGESEAAGSGAARLRWASPARSASTC